MQYRFFFRFTLFILLISSLSLSAFSQGWVAQNSGITNSLNMVTFLDSLQGWVVGSSGVILYTTNGGTTWSRQTSGTYNTLFGVAFTEPSTGWAVGSSSILHTTNGGVNWVAQTLPSGSYDLRAVTFVDDFHGWTVDESCSILRTTNGGSSWSAYTPIASDDLYGIAFTDTCNGWVVGSYNGGLILHTTNGGITWTQQTSGTTNTLNSVTFQDASHGRIVGANGIMLYTTNGGANWTTQTTGTTYSLNHIKAVDADHNWIVGANSIVLRTTNGGTNWSTQNPRVTTSFKSVSFVDADVGWAVGDNGTIIHTTNGGIFQSVLLATPNGGENLIVGSVDTLRWTSAAITGDVRIELNRNYPVGNWDSVAVLPVGTGSYCFHVSNPVSTGARFRVISLSCPTLGDTSDASFYIFQPRLILAALDTGNWYVGTSHTLRWFGTNLTGRVQIELNRNYPNGTWDSVTSGTGGNYAFTVPNTPTTNARFRVVSLAFPTVGDTCGFDINFVEQPSAVQPVAVLATKFAVTSAFPNPFNATTTLRFALPTAAPVSVDIYNANGRLIGSTKLGWQSVGSHDWQWNAAAFPSGVYYLHILAGNRFQTQQRVVLVK